MPFLSPFLSHKPVATEESSDMVRRAGVEALLAQDTYRPSSGGAVRLGAGGSDAMAREAGSIEEAHPRACSNPDCRQGWTMPWSGRRRLTFEGRYGCNGACIDGMIKAAIAREGVDRRQSSAEPHRHRVPLGLILLSEGRITHLQLQKALEAQRSSGTGRIGEWLISECGLDARYVTRALSKQWSCPVLSTEGFLPQAMAMVLPRVFVKQGILPLRIAGSRILYLGFQDHLDASLAFAMERMTGLRVESGMVGETEFAAARGRLLSCSSPVAYGKVVSDSESLAAHVAMVLEHSHAAASKLVRVHRHYWLRVWTGAGAGAGAEAGAVPMRAKDVRDFLFVIGA